MTSKNPPPPPLGCLWIEQAAALLGIQPGTLHKWRYLGTGPTSFKHAGRIVYREEAIAAYLARCEAADHHSNPAVSPLSRQLRPHVRSRRSPGREGAA